MLCLALAAPTFAASSASERVTAGIEGIIFAIRQPGKDPHYYANFGCFAFDPERKAYGQGGQLCRLDLSTGRLTVLLDDSSSGVRDPQVSYDRKTILFAYRKGGTPNYLLYEIRADGSGLRQLTDGPWDDIEPTSPSDDLGMPPWQSKFTDPRTRFSRHALYNFTRPEKSLLVLAPLAKEAGGYSVCGGTGTTATAVLMGTDDPDYRILLDSVLATQNALDGMKRFDMPGFRPGLEYVREMVRFEILPRAPDNPIDTYAADRAYWESHWYRPTGPPARLDR